VDAVTAVEAAVSGYARDHELREKVARLEAALAKARAELGDQPAFPCEQCGRVFGRAQALGSHRTRAHGGGAA
jgi:hypothetical protein